MQILSSNRNRCNMDPYEKQFNRAIVKDMYSSDDDQIKWSKHAVILIKQIECYIFSVLR
jgi:hypothetical protein